MFYPFLQVLNDITVVLLQFVLAFSIIQHSPVEYGDGTYQYPAWAIVIGWMLILCSIIPIPVVATLQLMKSKGSLREVILHTTNDLF
jgi:hypothetical protein